MACDRQEVRSGGLLLPSGLQLYETGAGGAGDAFDVDSGLKVPVPLSLATS